jgi:hypothetical protein
VIKSNEPTSSVVSIRKRKKMDIDNKDENDSRSRNEQSELDDLKSTHIEVSDASLFI